MNSAPRKICATGIRPRCMRPARDPGLDSLFTAARIAGLLSVAAIATTFVLIGTAESNGPWAEFARPEL